MSDADLGHPVWTRRPIDVAEVARLEEARQARGIGAISDEVEQVAGGLMCFAGIGAWANLAINLGMEGPVDPGDLDRLVAFYESRGVEARLELCPLADETLVAALAERQFVVREFESVLVCDLTRPAVELEVSDDVEVRRIDPHDEADVSAVVAVTARGFEVDDAAMHEKLLRRVMLGEGVATFLATVDDEPASAGGVEAWVPCAGLFGVATVPAHRRRGCQLALIAARLAFARGAGCRYACVGSKPGVSTARNAMRMGFEVAYTKAILGRPGPGLVRSS